MKSGVELHPIKSVGSCLILSVLYVSSLYVWSSELDRDHPKTVKRRFFSVFIVMLISPIFVYLFTDEGVLQTISMWEIMGFRLTGLILAVLIPFLLTALLFLGPLCVQLRNGVWKIYLEPQYWVNGFQNLLWLRNHVVGPLSEEFTFRACMMPLLTQSFTPITSVLMSPLFFGVAHLHHMSSRLRSGMEFKKAILDSCFQLLYTSIFGIYSAYLFTKTGHFIAPFIAHVFCNHMGFPDVAEVYYQKNPKRIIYCLLYTLGLLGWILLTPVVTNPAWYGNRIYWKS